jgi:hypothetical protein
MAVALDRSLSSPIAGVVPLAKSFTINIYVQRCGLIFVIAGKLSQVCPFNRS